MVHADDAPVWGPRIRYRLDFDPIFLQGIVEDRLAVFGPLHKHGYVLIYE
jgi:hypothetical protein